MTDATLVPEVHVLLFRESEVLLLLRANTGYEDGNFCVISGHVNRDEPATEAAVREAREELGIKIDPNDLDRCHVMQVRADSVRQGRVAFFYSCVRWDGEPRNMEPKKCDGIGWYPTNKLPDNVISYIRKAILESGRQFYSEFGW